MISGTSCTYQTGYNCNWKIASQTPGTPLSQSNRGQTITVGAPSNMTQIAQGFQVTGQGTGGLFCAITSFAVSGTVLSFPERYCGSCSGTNVAKPVDVASGEDRYTATDVSLSGPFGLSFRRSYSSLTQTNGNTQLTTAPASDIGNNWRHNYAQRLDLSQSASVGFYDESNMPFYFNGKPAAETRSMRVFRA